MVAQLVEQLLPTPEIFGSNPNIGKLLSTNCTFKKKMKLKKKKAGNGPSLKKCYIITWQQHSSIARIILLAGIN